MAEENDINTMFCTVQESTQPQEKGLYRSFGGYIIEQKIGKIKGKKYARIQIEHNYRMFKLLIWPEQYGEFEEQLTGAEKSFIVFDGTISYDAKYAKGNQWTLGNNAKLKVLR